MGACRARSDYLGWSGADSGPGGTMNGTAAPVRAARRERTPAKTLSLRSALLVSALSLGTACSSTGPRSHSASMLPSSPGTAASTTPAEDIAGSLMQGTSAGVYKPLTPGAVVPSTELANEVFPDAQHGFALAITDGGQQTYPANTIDGGQTWRIDGPLLHLAAAQAAVAVTQIGAGDDHTAFAWTGGAGNVIDATNDGGQHWWTAFIGDSVVSVAADALGTIWVVASGSPTPSRPPLPPLWIYRSADGGAHWTYTSPSR